MEKSRRESAEGFGKRLTSTLARGATGRRAQRSLSATSQNITSPWGPSIIGQEVSLAPTHTTSAPRHILNINIPVTVGYPTSQL